MKKYIKRMIICLAITAVPTFIFTSNSFAKTEAHQSQRASTADRISAAIKQKFLKKNHNQLRARR